MTNFIENSGGHFGEFGGCFAPKLLQPVLKKVEEVFEVFKTSQALQAEFAELLRNFAGHPTPIYHAQNYGPKNGAQIWVKREDLLHGGDTQNQ